MKKCPRVFFDTCVLIASVLNDEGASHFIIELGKKGFIEIIITTKVIEEARNSLLRKYGKNKVLDLYDTVTTLKTSIHTTLETINENKFIEIISDSKDYHILAGADKYCVDYLLTFDRRHFFTSKIKNANLPFEILLPGDFLKLFRKTFTP